CEELPGNGKIDIRFRCNLVALLSVEHERHGCCNKHNRGNRRQAIHLTSGKISVLPCPRPERHAGANVENKIAHERMYRPGLTEDGLLISSTLCVQISLQGQPDIHNRNYIPADRAYPQTL